MSELETVIRERDIYRAAYLGLRLFSDHALNCVRCVHMAAGGPECPVFARVTEACRLANELTGDGVTGFEPGMPGLMG